jgi:hypothetical protein
MKRTIMLIVTLLPLLTSCQSYTWLLYANPSLRDARQGQECRFDLFGLGVDFSGNKAMRVGGITKARSVEYQVSSFFGWGKECVIARGE